MISISGTKTLSPHLKRGREMKLAENTRRKFVGSASLAAALAAFDKGAKAKAGFNNNAPEQPNMQIEIPNAPAALDLLPSPLPPEGKVGEFNFLTGEWEIRHRKLKTGSKSEWIETRGEASCYHILDGMVSVEELRIPSWDFSGMGLRVLDREKKIWQDFWTNSKNGNLGLEPTLGIFKYGIGIFDSTFEENGKKTIWRGVWDRIEPNSHRWYQSISDDGGQSWELNWHMDWTRK